MTRKIRSLSSFLSLFLMAYVSVAQAQLAVEDTRQEDLKYRGQGQAGLCYAFAEEQLLKDLTCQRNCEYNASEWKYSIFDIAKVHQKKWIANYPDSETDQKAVDLLLNGSSYSFPYRDVDISSLRSSRCTLERYVLLLNRSSEINPEKILLHEQLAEIYEELKSNQNSSLRILPGPIANIFSELAKKAHSSAEFLESVIEYSLCDSKISIPQVQVHSRDLISEKEINGLILPLLKRGHSLYVGICAEVIRYEEKSEGNCGRHAVILKGLRGNSVQVVDSAFFSSRPRNKDGSSWIPLDLVVFAMSKSAKDFQRIKAKSKSNVEQIMAGLRVKLTESAHTLIDDIKRETIHFPLGTFQKELVRQFDLQGDDPFSQGLKKLILKKDIQRAEDLDLIRSEVASLLFDLAQPQLQGQLNSATSLQGFGIVWLEQLSR